LLYTLYTILSFIFFFFLMIRRPPRSTLFPYTRSSDLVYSLDAGKESQITDGISDARYPVFDKGGKWLLFAASTDVGLSSGWLDLSSFQHPILRNIYAAALKKGDPSPVEPQSDEEKTAEEKKDSADKGKEADKNKEEEKSKEGDKTKEGEKGKEGEKKKEEPVK